MLAIAAERRMRRWCTSMALHLVLYAPLASAAPLERRQIDHRQESDDSSHDSDPPLTSNISPQIWVPAVVVVLVLLGAFCFVWTRTSVISRLRGAASRAIHPSSSSTPTTREVTASQLTGGATVGRRAGTGTARRPIRRNRRTPSQISTTSLPVYMKEPGDHELVIFSGPEAMDASDAIAEAREAEDAEHDGRDSESLHRQDSRVSMLVLDTNPTPDSGPSPGLGLGPDQSAMSLGVSIADNGGENEPDTSTTQLLPRGHLHTSSRDTSDSSPLLMRRSSEVPSEAPPGYDYSTRNVQRDSTSSAAIDPPGLMDTSQASVESDPRSASPMSSSSPQTQPATPEPPRAAGRRSRLASRVSIFLHLRNGSNASSSTNTGEAGSPGNAERGRVSDAASEPAAISLNEPSPPSPVPILHAQQQQQQQGRHRHSSSSTSTLALPFRTLSHQRSINSLARQRSLSTLNPSASRSNPNLASPSLLSLSLAAGASQIGSPIPHTLVRTEIRYPASGPTPEQVKLLSARDGPGRFGVPYGEEAVAYARSSRLELQERESEPPPPVFESPTGESGGASAANGSVGAGTSGERRSSESVERGDEDEGDDPDALPEEFVPANGPSTAHSREGSSSSPNPSTENVTMETRIILPLFI